MNAPGPLTASVAISATPTRDHDAENFPTASLLLAKPLRAKVMAFYRFVRVADDIGDSPDLPAEEKLRRLDAMERGLDDPGTELPEAAAMHRAGVGVAEARLMLSAFRQDAVQTRYADWAALEDYCRRSADPVGRMLLRLHGDGDNAAANAAADGLCTALQVLNHLQDLVPRPGFARPDLPARSWMAIAGGEAGPLRARRTPAAARGAGCGARPRRGRSWTAPAPLPRAAEVAAAGDPERDDHRLRPAPAGAARRADPVLGRVALDQGGFRPGAGRGLLAGPRDRADLARASPAPGSSFARGMAALKGGRRRALGGLCLLRR